MQTILVIEDDHQIRRVIEGYLQQAGYRVLTASDGVTGLAIAQQEKPALIVLDLMLPGLDGLALARQLRASSDPQLRAVYILMLTARVEESERVAGLELGADDYVSKPFSPRELVARVRSALRRLNLATDTLTTSATATLQLGELTLHPAQRTVTLAQSPIELTAAEFDLLHQLMRHPNQPLTRDQLLDVIQADASTDSVYDRIIDTHIKNLRHKLGEAGRRNRFIETVHGVGYRFLG